MSILEITPTGKLKYPKITIPETQNPESKVGDWVWKWNHTRLITRKAIGQLTHLEPWMTWDKEIRYTWKFTNLDGDSDKIYNRVILPNDVYEEILAYFGVK